MVFVIISADDAVHKLAHIGATEMLAMPCQLVVSHFPQRLAFFHMMNARHRMSMRIAHVQVRHVLVPGVSMLEAASVLVRFAMQVRLPICMGRDHASESPTSPEIRAYC